MEENKVLATIGERQITQKEFSKILRNLDQQRAMQFSSPEGQARLLEELISQELLYLDAKKKGFDQHPDFIAELQLVTDNLLKQYAINQLLKDIEIPESEVLKYYEAHQDQFMSEPQVRASHILVDSKEKALEILEELKGDLSFEAAAEKYSRCPSKANGGDLGFFGQGKMVREFEEAAFSLNVNEVSDVVQTHFGYHIIKVTDQKGPGIIPFDTVRPQLTQQLLALKQQEVYYAQVEELKKEFPVTIHQ